MISLLFGLFLFSPDLSHAEEIATSQMKEEFVWQVLNTQFQNSRITYFRESLQSHRSNDLALVWEKFKLDLTFFTSFTSLGKGKVMDVDYVSFLMKIDDRLHESFAHVVSVEKVEGANFTMNEGQPMIPQVNPVTGKEVFLLMPDSVAPIRNIKYPSIQNSKQTGLFRNWF